MKKLLTGAIALSLVAGSVVIAKPAKADQLALSLCTYVQGDDTMRMRKKLRDSRVRIRDIYSKIQCNGQTLLQFAMSNGSNDIGTFMVGRLSVDDLKAMNDYQWAQSNGHAGSPIAAAIKERAGL
ncbi:hypothetical protein CWI84_06940 [Idiomarina tyrosinivorans]|uniref:DUF3718 domain-containing protein n=1 Tax=Idiomarina tyrosinivorans TaxID=1445662 RepID=A0A432ZR25_9GAMM|nr:DUF3718 domain-containing protein [Idiomarina tyrosinivorans]RUO80360.1 hypothetical protein CWI84_06940 [Idiomarina tyrosinivorans]